MWGLAYPLPSGDPGTYATLARMRQLARTGAYHPAVRELAVGITAATPEPFRARTLAHWVGGRTRFLPDPLHAEVLHTPDLLVRMILTRGAAAVDCDDVAVLAAALGLAVGLRARFVVVGFDSPQAPYRHVWTELEARPGSWVPVDPTRPAQLRQPITRRYVVEV